MATSISHDGINHGFQAGVINGNIGNVIIRQTEPLDQACLRALRTTDPRHDKNRIKETNGGLLEDCYQWVLDNEVFKQWQNSQSNRLLWIRGDPGKGKTMLLCGIIEELQRSHRNTATVSFFFCQATDIRINSATSVLRGLIYLLIEKSPSLLSHVRPHYEKAGRSLFEDVNAWSALTAIFTSILEDSSLKAVYLVIDALDECTSGLDSLLRLIVQKSAAHLQIKWVISSRNHANISKRLNSAAQIAPIPLELNETSVSEAVKLFIDQKVNALTGMEGYDPETREIIRDHLQLNSQGTFLWVALVCKELEETEWWHAKEVVRSFPLGLSALYRRMLDQVHKARDANICKQILSIVSLVYRPVTLGELSTFIETRISHSINFDMLRQIIGLCGSFITIREQTVTFIHHSAKDFLTNEASTGIIPRGVESEHHTIFTQCLSVLIEILRRDMFDLKLPGILINDIGVPSPNPLAYAEYACVYWVNHLDACKYNATYRLSLKNRESLDIFLQQKYLHWLEALSILNCLSDGIRAMTILENLVKEESESCGLLERIQDATRFILYHRTGIESSPLQDERPDWVLNDPMVERNWSPCLQTLEGHSYSVNSIAWSPDGSRLASGSTDNTVRIWDPATGQCSLTLNGHSDRVLRIAWSPDGSRLASASWDNTVGIWDLATGQCALTLKGHSNPVFSIAWSQDGTRLVSVSGDSTIRIWDPVIGHYVLTLKGHSGAVFSVSWSEDGNWLASGSQDNTVRIWDPATGQCALTLKGHSDSVNSITWSPDRKRLASASNDGTVRIWALAISQSILTLEGHSSGVRLVIWTQDGSRLASASGDSDIRIWDSSTGQCVSTLKGHIHSINSIVWSQDGSRLASASGDSDIRIWDSSTGQCVLTLEGHSHSVNSITWSPDGRRLASASDDKTIRVWNPATGQYASILRRHSNPVNSIAWSPDGRQLASASHDKSVKIWDLASAQCELTFEGHSHSVLEIAWSPDGSQLASASWDNTVRIWDIATGQGVSTFKGHSLPVVSISWSQDGTRLASGSFDDTIRIWDPFTSQCISIFKGHYHGVQPVIWSENGSQLASGSYDNTIRIWILATAQCVSTLKGHSGPVLSIAWSPDESRLASGSKDNTVRIWDLATGQCVLTLNGHSNSVNSIAWSPDGSRLASGSGDNTVRIWDPATGQCKPTIHISSPDFVQFDKVNLNHLHTSIGTFDIGLTGTVTSAPHYATLPEQYGYGLNNDHSWITYNGVNLLWLPTEYRPTDSFLFAVSATNLAIACSSGLVIFLALAEQNPIPGI